MRGAVRSVDGESCGVLHLPYRDAGVDSGNPRYLGEPLEQRAAACAWWHPDAALPGEAEALTDLLRLSKAMSLKSAIAGLPFGGGKAVVIGDPRRDKSKELLLALAAQIDRLGGTFFAGEDVGISAADLDVMRARTRYVVGRVGADTWRPTAYGVYQGIRAAVKYRFGVDSLAEISVAVQGAGRAD